MGQALVTPSVTQITSSGTGGVMNAVVHVPVIDNTADAIVAPNTSGTGGWILAVKLESTGWVGLKHPRLTTNAPTVTIAGISITSQTLTSAAQATGYGAFPGSDATITSISSSTVAYSTGSGVVATVALPVSITPPSDTASTPSDTYTTAIIYTLASAN